MIQDRARYGLLVIVLGIVVGGISSLLEPSLAQTKQCSAQQIENNIKDLATNPTLVDTLVTCGSDAVPILTHYLETSPRDRSIELFGEIPDRRLLVIVTLGKMGTRAASSTKVLLNLMGNSASSIDLDKVILYTLWQINDVPTRNSIVNNLLAVVKNIVETPEKRLNAAAKIDYIYRDLLKTKISIVYTQIVTTALTQIISENKNNLETRSQALSLLKNFDLVQAQKLEKQYLNLAKSVGGSCTMNDTNIQISMNGSGKKADQSNDVTQASNGGCVGNTVNTTNVQTQTGGTDRATQRRRSSQEINGSNNSPTGINMDPVKVKTNVQTDVDNPADRLNNNAQVNVNNPNDRRKNNEVNAYKPADISSKNLPAVCRDPLKQYPVIKIVFSWKCE
jgi:hypothetical protein